MARGMKVMIDPALPDHRKIRALARSLKIHPMQALGHVIALWCRVMKESPLGVIRGWSNDDISDACKWTGDAARLVSALRLKSIRFIERTEIHDWIEEQGDKVAEREASRKRKAEERERKRLAKRAAEEEIKKSRVTGEGVTRDTLSRVTGGDVTLMSRPPVPSQQQQPSQSVPSRSGDAGGGATTGGGGAGGGDAVVAVRPSLFERTSQRSMDLLQSIGIDPALASSFAAHTPVGVVLDVVVHARTQKKPAGYARRALEKGWRMPVASGSEVDELLQQLLADEASADARINRLTGAIGLNSKKIERLPGESDEAWLRRIQETRLREASA